MDYPLVFKLLKCKPVTKLLDLFDVYGYDVIQEKGYSYYLIPMTSFENQRIYGCLNDLDIYIHSLNLYVSKYILLQKTPNKHVVKLINKFTCDDLFLHCTSVQRLTKAANTTTIQPSIIAKHV